MAGTKKRPSPTRNARKHRLQFLEAERVVAHAGDVPIGENGHEAPGVVEYVLGGGGAGLNRNPAQRDFPLITRKKGESEAAHLMRVVHQVDEAIAAGGTHKLVPREQADWLADHPRVAEYLAGPARVAKYSRNLVLIDSLSRIGLDEYAARSAPGSAIS